MKVYTRERFNKEFEERFDLIPTDADWNMFLNMSGESQVVFMGDQYGIGWRVLATLVAVLILIFAVIYLSLHGEHS